MVSIRKMQSRDVVGLSDLFPEKDEDEFNEYYIEQLQDKRVVLIAMSKTDEVTTYIGYANIVWESDYSQFWRRHIPEIVDLNVASEYRQQGNGTALIAACEKFAREKGYSTIGISVEQSPQYADANRLYQALGYVADGFGITEPDNQLHLVKTL